MLSMHYSRSPAKAVASFLSSSRQDLFISFGRTESLSGGDGDIFLSFPYKRSLSAFKECLWVANGYEKTKKCTPSPIIELIFLLRFSLVLIDSVSGFIINPVGSLVVRASDFRPEGLGSIPDATKYPPSTHGFTCRNCGGGDRGRVAIYHPFGEFCRAKSHCHLYGAQGQRQAYLLPMPRCFVGLDLTTSDRLVTVTLQYPNPIESSKLKATAAGSIAFIFASLQHST
ncbi:hypothetical protein TNCV_4751111 [Trichonephila clavipes]|nr:hypothetical protein TNCV_4751111 [Trichonephila clavipes]